MYKVIKYFDDHYDGIVKENISLEEAKSIVADWRKRCAYACPYTSYEIRPM